MERSGYRDSLVTLSCHQENGVHITGTWKLLPAWQNQLCGQDLAGPAAIHSSCMPAGESPHLCVQVPIQWPVVLPPANAALLILFSAPDCFGRSVSLFWMADAS